MLLCFFLSMQFIARRHNSAGSKGCKRLAVPETVKNDLVWRSSIQPGNESNKLSPQGKLVPFRILCLPLPGQQDPKLLPQSNSMTSLPSFDHASIRGGAKSWCLSSTTALRRSGNSWKNIAHWERESTKPVPDLHFLLLCDFFPAPRRLLVAAECKTCCFPTSNRVFYLSAIRYACAICSKHAPGLCVCRKHSQGKSMQFALKKRSPKTSLSTSE